ncbi:Coupling of ubiquitin conjugation to ER degradation protein 1 [Neolecta irregularis DAH-3]|uniref:Coupling of ubiquitin conjugation to ER degradation protein 1 n=1 Tax=Neolecta irregularis (strain DAH-3) TaxID=1198029 RepID=A0A1U7LSD1_NEOID|nr:Coupling of ubiquitin conjugation to ER degradation protein 1 [Neolecta irregularis DAH-3]|eukprot:OLL25554.1 Coupling of ubiquitin conjugation to ER degradation protein 1 [Neolecta irregularis DAH-3]
MFPTISERSIAYDLSKTGSVEATTEKLLTSNTLPEPPATYVYMFAPSQPVQQPSGRASSAQKGHSYPDLITRFHLNDKVKSGLYTKPEPLGIQWSDSKAEREAMFKRKREQFILQGLKNQKSFEKTKLSAASHE